MSDSPAREVNFDGIVGATHNYAGLAFGNVASADHGGAASSPKQAALQGLEKAWKLACMGLPQGVLPPQERPHLPTLRRLGFAGQDEAALLANVASEVPQLLAAASSASAMWAANAATVSPAADTADGRTHITPANLCTMFHRSIEPPVTTRLLRAIFADSSYIHHPPLPAGTWFADEGAANHMRLGADPAMAGVELFVYGDALVPGGRRPRRFPARQTLPACQAIARNHRLLRQRVVYAQQHPAAIDAGVFHNDVIAVGHGTVLLYHQHAFLDTAGLKSALQRVPELALDYIEVPATAVSLPDAVRSYLFNSQLVSPPGQAGLHLLAPAECRAVSPVYRYLQELEAGDSPISKVHYLDLRQSMNNGGGPACLRLQVVMSQQQLANCKARVLLDQALYRDLRSWVEKHYRDVILPRDLADPALLRECRTGLDELTRILRLGCLYDFQLEPGQPVRGSAD